MRYPIILIAIALSACSPKNDPPATAVSPSYTEADITYLQTESENLTREQAIAKLTAREQSTAAALAAGIEKDPIARTEIARILATRHRELVLHPKIQSEQKSITEQQLRETYQANTQRYIKPERRQTAVLWLDPGNDPKRRSNYLKKMEHAKTWLKENPTKDFGTLSIDHSQHAASRFKNGVIGWLSQGGTGWSKTVADIAYTLESPGATSDIIENEEGIFLVRLMAIEAPRTIPFETAKHQLESEHRHHIRKALTKKFDSDIAASYDAARHEL